MNNFGDFLITSFTLYILPVVFSNSTTFLVAIIGSKLQSLNSTNATSSPENVASIDAIPHYQTLNSTTATSSCEIVASIDDILTEILLKLPIKPLIRSKLVSKHWLSLISNHYFCLMRNPTPNPAQGILLRRTTKNYPRQYKYEKEYEYGYVPLASFSDSFVPFINLNFTNAPLTTQILHSCNGLLLCCESIVSKPPCNCFYFQSVVFTLDCKLYVCNPTTNVSVVLPVLPSFTVMSPKSSTLVFDPVISPHYKVVFVERVSEDEVVGKICEIWMYSSETGSWSYGCNVGKERCSDVLGSGVYWNGSVHWLNQEFSARNPRNSLRFHVDTRTLVEMPSPPVVIDKNIKTNIYFGESYDHLHFIECILPRFNVYEMKRDYSNWFVKYKVDLSPFMAVYPEVIGYYNEIRFDVIRVLSLIRGENDNESNLVLRILNKAMKFHLFDGTSEKLCDIMPDEIWFEQTPHSEGYVFADDYALDYIQSLCPV